MLYRNVTITKKLHKTTDKIVQKIFGLQSNNVIVDLRSKHKLCTKEKLLFKDLLMSLFMFRQIKCFNPSVFQDIFAQSLSLHNTRCKSNIISKRCSNTFSEQSITFCGSTYWTKIPVTLRDTAISIQAFSNKLRKLLSNNITNE